MKKPADKTSLKNSKAVDSTSSDKKRKSESDVQFEDNRPELIAQRKLKEMADNSSQARKNTQLQALTNSPTATPIQKKESELEPELKEEPFQPKFDTIQKTADKEDPPIGIVQQKTANVQKKDVKTPNKTGLHDTLKSGIENLSGISLDDVKVYYNSEKPAQLQAHAFTQGTDIHMAPGQEKHLPHEAWHVVQQKQGGVKPTKQLKGKVNINDDNGLEKEADVMGAKAAVQKSSISSPIVQGKFDTSNSGLKSQSIGASQQPVQLKHDIYNTANLVFATNDRARLPSFYFSTDGKNSIRVRQQHGRGPTIENKGANVQHYFFADEDKAREFFAAARKNDLTAAQSIKRSIVPHTNDYHVEYKVGDMTTAHISGGRIIPPGDFSYTDDDYEQMAAAVTDWKAEESQKPDFKEKKSRREYADTKADKGLAAP